MAEEIRIEFTRFSAFYSPLIATMAGGFLKAEGLEGKHSVSAPGKSAIAGLLDGSVHVAQSAPSQGFTPLEQGKVSPTLHFAQINEKDGFFLTGPQPRPGLHVGQAQGQEGHHRPRRPADGHVQVRLLQARTRFQGDRGGRCRLDRQDDRSLPQRRGRFHPPAGPRAAAARARQGRAHRGVARRCHRPLRVLEPCRHARLARRPTWPRASCAPIARPAPG